MAISIRDTDLSSAELTLKLRDIGTKKTFEDLIRSQFDKGLPYVLGVKILGGMYSFEDGHSVFNRKNGIKNSRLYIYYPGSFSFERFTSFPRLNEEQQIFLVNFFKVYNGDYSGSGVVGLSYHNGKGIEKNEVEAQKYLLLYIKHSLNTPFNMDITVRCLPLYHHSLPTRYFEVLKALGENIQSGKVDSNEVMIRERYLARGNRGCLLPPFFYVAGKGNSQCASPQHIRHIKLALDSLNRFASIDFSRSPHILAYTEVRPEHVQAAQQAFACGMPHIIAIASGRALNSLNIEHKLLFHMLQYETCDDSARKKNTQEYRELFFKVFEQELKNDCEVQAAMLLKKGELFFLFKSELKSDSNIEQHLFKHRQAFFELLEPQLQSQFMVNKEIDACIKSLFESCKLESKDYDKIDEKLNIYRRLLFDLFKSVAENNLELYISYPGYSNYISLDHEISSSMFSTLTETVHSNAYLQALATLDGKALFWILVLAEKHLFYSDNPQSYVKALSFLKCYIGIRYEQSEKCPGPISADDISCLRHTGICYLKLGGSENKKLAFHYFHEAMLLGDLPSQSYMGWMLLNGIGCMRDAEQGLDHLEESLRFGNGEAALFLGLCCLKGIDGKHKKEEAFKYFKFAEKQMKGSNLNPFFYVGYCYAHAIGVVKDLNRACRYYTLAGALGFTKGYEHYISIQYKLGNHEHALRCYSKWKNEGRMFSAQCNELNEQLPMPGL